MLWTVSVNPNPTINEAMMKPEDIKPRIPLADLIPAWCDLSVARQAQIESQINQEWWRGYYEGRRQNRDYRETPSEQSEEAVDGGAVGNTAPACRPAPRI